MCKYYAMQMSLQSKDKDVVQSKKKKKKANYNKSEYTQIYAKHKTFKNNYRTQNLEETLIFI